MLDPRAVRGFVKRRVAWEDGPRNRWQSALRSHFMRDPDCAVRYGPALAAARRARRILEVGSGPYGVAPFVNRPVLGVDVDFSGPRHARLHPTRAHGSHLPFPDGTFDLVLCFDVLEHVPRSARSQVVQELARVCRGRLMMAFPFGQAAADADAGAARMYDPEVRAHRWLDEHQTHGLPSRQDLQQWQQDLGVAPARAFGYTPLWLWWMARLEEARFRPHLTIVRRVLLPLVSRLLWRLPARHCYRWFLEFDLGRNRGDDE